MKRRICEKYKSCQEKESVARDKMEGNTGEVRRSVRTQNTDNNFTLENSLTDIQGIPVLPWVWEVPSYIL